MLHKTCMHRYLPTQSKSLPSPKYYPPPRPDCTTHIFLHRYLQLLFQLDPTRYQPQVATSAEMEKIR